MTLASPEQALSTLRNDGTRRWIRPRLSHGRFLTRRRLVAYFLMALFFVLPFVRGTFPYLGLAGKPLFLLDIVHRKFTLFGFTFLPTDTFLLALAGLFWFVGIFLFTAIFGRLWCGWACPQTVYMEFLYRPLERLFEGTAGVGGSARKSGPLRKVGFFVAALVVTAIPAHTFLAYFVGVEDLSHWIFGSPFQHSTAFLVMAAVTLLMFFDFYWFREQLCLIACPYGRFQSVLLDRLSLIVTYDKTRGEPRGKRSSELKVLSPESTWNPALKTQNSELRTENSHGDCVDCHLCVTTCPTGIDIRDGLQLECVNCTQCIDACDAVMEKLQRPRGLIRYSSQAAMDVARGATMTKPRKLRFRVVFYPALLAILSVAWLLVFAGKGTADVAVLRNAGAPYTILGAAPGAPGRVANSLKLKITNRTERQTTYHFELIDFPQGRIDLADRTVIVPAGASQTVGFVVEAPPEVFVMGKREVFLRITDDGGFAGRVLVKLLGPVYAGESQPSTP